MSGSQVSISVPQKLVECDDCGWVNPMTKAFPLRLSSCKTCGSTHIRIHKPRKDRKT